MLLAADLAFVGARLVDGNFADAPNPAIGEQIGVLVTWQTTDLPAGSQYQITVATDGVPVTLTLNFGQGQSGTNQVFATFVGNFAAAGTHSVTVTLDSAGSLSESSESNNTGSLTFTTDPVPDLPQRFIFPLAGESGHDWVIGNYLDSDPRSGVAADFRGGPYQYDGHPGVDIGPANFAAIDRGIAVLAMADGVVTDVTDGNPDRASGLSAVDIPANYITIDHGNGWLARYFHVGRDSITVKPGDVVSQGEVIAMMGSAGASAGLITGPHLHFDVTHNGRLIETFLAPDRYYIDPLPYQADATPTVLDAVVTNYNSFGSPDVLERMSALSEFSMLEDDTAFLTYKFSHLNDGDDVAVHWKRPDGTVAQTNGFTQSGISRNGTHQWVLDDLIWKQQTGQWTVDISLAGVVQYTTSFKVVAGASAAEIRVRQNGGLVLDGRTTSYNLGTAAAGTVSPTLTFNIGNHGGSSLTLGVPRLPDGFSLLGAFPESVAAESSATFTVQLDTDVIGHQFGDIEFTTNDTDETFFNFPVEGTVTGAVAPGSPELDVNDAGGIAYVLGDSPGLLAASATLTDDGASTFSGSQLVVEQTVGRSTSDMLQVRHGGSGVSQVGVSGDNVTWSGTIVGSKSGSTPGRLIITFNAAADLAAIQAVMRNITFASVDVSSAAPRTISMEFIDAAGLPSGRQYREIVPVRPALRLSINDRFISENGGISSATLSRTGDTSTSLTVTLTPNDSTELLIPASAIIPAGQAELTFSLSAVNDAATDGTQSVTVTASAGGFYDVKDSIDITDDETTLTYTVINTLDSGPGSLRQAILDANLANAAAHIAFAIPVTDSGFVDVDNGTSLPGADLAADVFRISVQSALPGLSNVKGHAIHLDATTQQTLSGDSNPNGPEIELTGSAAGVGVNGFVTVTNDVSIRGLNIHSFDGSGIVVLSNRVTLAGNSIGVDPTGRTARGVGNNGIDASRATALTIGGTMPGDRNIISASGNHGVSLHDGTANVHILGNFIGTDVTGLQDLGNAREGIFISASHGVSVGGGSIGAGNVISGNNRDGIHAENGSSNITVAGNLIGVDRTGAGALGNGEDGFESIDVTQITIGGHAAGERNVMSSNGRRGMNLLRSRAINITGNHIGTNAAGDAVLGNISHGIELFESLQATISGNLVSGNAHGITLSDTGYLPSAVEWPIASGGNGHFYVFVTLQRAWEEALQLASAAGGSLASITNAAENTFLTNSFGSTQPWIGITDRDIEGQFKWTSGDPLSFTNWRAGEPNNFFDEDAAWLNSDGTWNDADLSIQTEFIIEFSSAPDASVLRTVFGNVTIADNYVGTDVTGTLDFGNLSDGIRLSNSPQISIRDNVTSGNGRDGISILGTSPGISIQGNFVGTNASGTIDVGNGSDGIQVQGIDGILIGGTESGTGNVISGNGSDGIDIFSGAKNVTLLGNMIGTDVTGQVSLGNTANGVLIENSSFINIGGTAASARNVISGNSDNGIYVYGGSHDISVAGNYLGILSNGQTAAGNSRSGVSVDQSQNITIGGLTPADRNVISGNGSAIRLSRTQTASITSNYIGTDVSGNLPVPNGRSGQHSTAVQIVDSSNVILGAPGAGNVVSASVGSFARGVELFNSQQMTVQANRIGTNAAGNLDLGNDQSGLYIQNSADVLVGGTAPNQGNVISGNANAGIVLDASRRITVQANRIGTSADGMLSIPNFEGISITNSSDVLIGGPTAAAGNLISANQEDGIELYGFQHNSNQSNQITVRNNLIGTDSTGNGMLGNGGRGIRVTRTDNIQILDNVISDSGAHGIQFEGRDEDYRVFEWPVSAGGNGHFYTLIRPMSWSDAESAAAGIGGHLVGITSAEESAFIASVFRSSTFAHRGDRLFMGLSDAAAEGTFSWTTGEPFSFTNWSPFEPNGGNNENHVELLTDHKWNDTNGGFNHLYGLVEFTSAPDSALLAALQNPGTITQRITGNKIGVAADGITMSGNASHGIEIASGSARRNVVIGGNLPGESNIIAGNSQDGISINNSASGAVVTVTGNSIYGNGDLGFDLGNDGVTGNDLGDADTGVNGLQNFPVISGITVAAGSTFVSGTLHSAPDSVFDIELYASSATVPADAEGEHFLGTVSVTTDSAGNATFSAAVSGTISGGQWLTATATDQNGNTSEFSAPTIVILPEIAVDLGGVVLNNNAGVTDFGTARIAGTTISRTFRVRNTGNAPLSLGALSLPAGFTLTNPLLPVIAPGGSDVFTVRLDTNVAGTKSGQIEFITSDSDENPFRISIAGVVSLTNVVPIVGAFDTTVTYVENAVPVLLDSNATVVDVDSADFAGGRLTVAITANAQTTDRISIRNTGTGVGQIGTELNAVLYGGVSIGTFSGTTSLVVILNSSATPAAVQALLRSVTFRSLSENPVTSPRTVRVTLTDGDGGTSNLPTKTVNVIRVNDVPIVGAFDTTVTYVENAVPVLLDSNATVVDVDSADFAGGRLTVAITANAQTTDRISIRNTGTGVGQIGTELNAVLYGGVSIGTFSGTTSLIVTLNSSATPAAVQALLRSVTFHSQSENPVTLPRTVRVTLTDGDGGTSNLPTKTVNVIRVNDVPIVGAFDTTVTYVENAVPVLLDSNATVVDVDSADFAGGRLTVAITANAQTTDRISIRNTGTGVGQIGTELNAVLYGGVSIGTFSGTTSLIVTLNSSATPAAVQALLRSVTFRSLSENPVTSPRTVRVTLTDGDGGTSNLPTKTVNVTRVNDAPIVGAFDTAVTYVENAVPVLLDSNATIIDVDSTDFAGGRLTVAITGNVQTTDRISIRSTGNGVGQIATELNAVLYGGVSIGTFSGTTSLVVTLNSSATPAAVQALLRNITFHSLSENPVTSPRTVRVTLTDGDGGTSNLPTKTVNVTAVNDLPVIGPLATGQIFIPGGATVSFASVATVADADSSNFDTGRLTVRVSSNAQASDLLSITHQGTTAGKIGVTAESGITFGGVLIGTFSGGTGTTPLVISFNSIATSAAVQTLIRSLTYRSTLSTASTAARTISLSLTDGDGGTSNLVTTTLSVPAPAARMMSVPGPTEIDSLFSSESLSEELMTI